MAALLNDGAARAALLDDQLHAPHLIDTEVLSALRRHVARRGTTAGQGRVALDVWQRLAVTRYAGTGLAARVWDLRENVSAYDSTFVALAEALGCPLLTADGRLARAPGTRCTVMVVPR